MLFYHANDTDKNVFLMSLLDIFKCTYNALIINSTWNIIIFYDEQ